METDFAKAQFAANLSLRPRGSQTLLTVLAVIAALALFTGFYFLWHKPNLAWVPLIIGVLGFAACFVGWYRAQPHVDLESPKATSILSHETGMEIHTDSRTLASRQAVQGLGELFSTLAQRQPLPEPDGLVDSAGAPVPNSKEDAAARVRTANSEAEALFRETAGAFAEPNGEVAAEQPEVVEHEVYGGRGQ